MPCIPTTNGIICGPNLYEFTHNGRVWFFEIHSYFGPWPLRQDNGEPFSRAGKAFWTMWDAFSTLSLEEQEVQKCI